MELEAGSPMETLPIDDNMKNVTEADEKETAMLFTAKSRKPAAPTVKEATKATTGAPSSSGSGLTGRPLWEAIIQSVLHHSAITGHEEQVVCNFGNGRIPCPHFFKACQDHQTAV
eukprot:2745193-Pyramimonas_sp.AAC.1